MQLNVCFFPSLCDSRVSLCFAFDDTLLARYYATCNCVSMRYNFVISASVGIISITMITAGKTTTKSGKRVSIAPRVCCHYASHSRLSAAPLCCLSSSPPFYAHLFTNNQTHIHTYVHWNSGHAYIHTWSSFLRRNLDKKQIEGETEIRVTTKSVHFIFGFPKKQYLIFAYYKLSLPYHIIVFQIMGLALSWALCICYISQISYVFCQFFLETKFL